jgi:hypothetical protein
MSEKLEPIIVDAVSNNNFKTIAESAAFFMSLSMRDATESQRRMSAMSDVATGHNLKVQNEMDIGEANAIVKANTGFDRASQSHDLGVVMGQLGAVVASLQQYVKVAQSTPKVTG